MSDPSPGPRFPGRTKFRKKGPDPDSIGPAPSLAPCHSIPCCRQVDPAAGRAWCRIATDPAPPPPQQVRGGSATSLNTGDLALLLIFSIIFGVAAGCLTRAAGTPMEAAL